jgi:hypothetical protein
MIDMNALSLGPRTLNVSCWLVRDVEGERQLEVDRRLVERRVDRVVVVGHRRVPGQHHAAQAELPDLPEIADAVVHGAHRGLPDAQQPLGMGGAVLGDPQVVGVEARLLVLEVRVVAEHHADGRVEHLGADAVARLVREPGFGVPAPAMQVLEAGPEHRQVLRRLAGGRDESHRDGLVEAVDDEEIAALGVVHESGSPVPEARVDPGGVRVGWLGDVRVGGDDRDVGDHIAPWARGCGVSRGRAPTAASA